jgi:para-nitrobenzyl esterase
VQIPRAGIPYEPSPDENEDCLSLNVYAPPATKGKKMPVIVWIHGGAYKNGNGRYDFSNFIANSNNSIVGIQIQYRVSELSP